MNLFGWQISRPARSAIVDPAALPSRPSSTDPTERMIPAVPSEYYQMLPKLTPLQIRMLLISGMQGNFSWMYDLVSIMQDTWPRLLKNLHEVRDACRNTNFNARPYVETPGEKPTDSAIEKAAFIDKCLISFEPISGGDERNFSGTVYDMAGAIVMPRIQEIIWKRGPAGEWMPRATAWVHSRRLGLLPSGRLGLQPVLDQDISYVSTQNRAPAELPPNKFIYSIYPTRDGALTMSGLLRPLAWWWGSMMYGRDWTIIFAQKFGTPFVWATYKAGLDEAARVKLDAMLAAWANAGYGSFQEGVTLNTVDSKSLTQDNPQRWLIDHADEYADLLVKGESISDQTKGNLGEMRGNSQVSHKVRNQRIEGMCTWLADDITDQIVRPICLLNYGNTDEMPKVVADFSEPQTGLELAQTAQIWLGQGMFKMTAEDAAEISGLPLTEAPEQIEPIGTQDFEESTNGNGNGNGSKNGNRSNIKAMLHAVASPATTTEKLQRATLTEFVSALAKANEPLTKRLQVVAAITDDAEWFSALRAVMFDFPELAKACLKATNPAAETLANGMAESVKAGITRTHASTGRNHKRF